jgi:hypothetical protein
MMRERKKQIEKGSMEEMDGMFGGLQVQVQVPEGKERVHRDL